MDLKMSDILHSLGIPPYIKGQCNTWRAYQRYPGEDIRVLFFDFGGFAE